MSNNETKLTCPICGAEFSIPEHTEVSAGVVIGKDSNLGEIHPQLASAASANLKIEKLREAGVDVSNMFSLTDANGLSRVVEIFEGQIRDVVLNFDPADDPIVVQIHNNGTIPNNRLFRRWIMSQVFHMLNSRHGFNGALKHKGYQYQWRMIIDELRIQAKLSVTDSENFTDRNRWLNKDVVVDMARGYISALDKKVKSLPQRRRRGVVGVMLKNRFIPQHAITTETTTAVECALNDIAESSTPQSLYTSTVRFYNKIKRLWITSTIPMSDRFIDMYKGVGAYYTAKNLILFHGCRVENEFGKKLSMIGSLKRLKDKTVEYGNSKDGWRLFGFMKKILADNSIDIAAKINEWRNQKSNN